MAWQSLIMERCLRPLQTLFFTEFGTASEVTIHGQGVQGDRWIDLRYLRDDQATEPHAFSSLRRVDVRIRYLRRKPANATTANVQEMLDQVDRLKYVLLTNHNLSGKWLDGQIGPCEGQPDLSDLGDSFDQYEGVEMLWTCKIHEVIS